MSTVKNWTDICNLGDLVDNSGVCALVNGEQVAIFKIKQRDETYYYAISNWDPIGKANVLYRGLIGSVADKTVVISPLFKQRYCLASGECLDDEQRQVNVFGVRVEGNKVQLALAS
ncbi:nitrite reductase small subunit NirD [Paraglaciecola polaris]|uniref:Nitrite reductase (NAD(P)H) small subunit n=1 Tax=Paraglaciecola polaris LMG 21857 TaxID=1129793 RepID=K7AEY3_9ALTE|nr:nitrite reductase small subunit NirD [Paraglaciecola polaris]GAC33845.1 nitrite reductase (NAD(P)H) small subunit [Paraglaciecola polaris LMG 21857]|tara:strand:- start:44 stop:391 length:348 start_codon:yes stop_codon:yes gene_type:complete